MSEYTVYNIGGDGYDSNVYLVICEQPIIIDTGTGQGIYFQNVIKRLKKIISPEEINKIILTHMHFDHSGGASVLSNLTNADIFVHEYDAGALKTGDNILTGARMFGGCIEPTDVKTIKNNEIIDCGNVEFSVIHTPGHTAGSISLYEKTKKTLFSGDLVFADGGVGRWDLPGGDYNKLLDSLNKIKKIDIENLYPGHGRYVLGNGNTEIKKSFEMIRWEK